MKHTLCFSDKKQLLQFQICSSFSFLSFLNVSCTEEWFVPFLHLYLGASHGSYPPFSVVAGKGVIPTTPDALMGLELDMVLPGKSTPDYAMPGPRMSASIRDTV